MIRVEVRLRGRSPWGGQTRGRGGGAGREGTSLGPLLDRWQDQALRSTRFTLPHTWHSCANSSVSSTLRQGM